MLTQIIEPRALRHEPVVHCHPRVTGSAHSAAQPLFLLERGLLVIDGACLARWQQHSDVSLRGFIWFSLSLAVL
eukprot:6930528-Prymnesium_polylepis.4